MAKVEIEAPEFKPVVITLESQLEVNLITELFLSVDLNIQKHKTDKASREIIRSIRQGLRGPSSYSGSSVLLRGYLTIIPTEID